MRPPPFANDATDFTVDRYTTTMWVGDTWACRRKYDLISAVRSFID